MSTPVLDTDTIVIGTLTTLTPTAARPVLDRLEPGDFPRWPARAAHRLLRAMVLDGLPSLDVATLVGYAQHTAAIEAHQWAGFTRFLCDAVSVCVPAAALDFHVGLLMQATYRRRLHAVVSALAVESSESVDTLVETLHAMFTEAAEDVRRLHARTEQNRAVIGETMGRWAA